MTDDLSQASPRRSRRDEYAELTRQAVVEAARSLFAERGYFATTVNEIADLSRVSPGTVYQQCGGKQGLLRTLMDVWTTDPQVQKNDALIKAADTLEDALAILSAAYLGVYHAFDDIIQVIVATAPHDEEAAAALDLADGRHRSALLEMGRKVMTLGNFSASFSDEDFADLALYHYGAQSGFHFTIAVLGWSEERAQAWLHEQFARSLLDNAKSSPR